MESIGVFADGEWDSLSKYFGTEEVDFTAQFMGQSSFSLDHQNEGLMMNFLATSSANATNHDEGLFVNSNSQYFNMPQGNYALSHDDHHNVTNDYLSMSMDISIMDQQSKLEMDIDIINNNTTNNQLPPISPNNELKLKRKFDMPELNTTEAAVDKVEIMKKPRVQRNASRTNKKNSNVQPKKNGSEGEEMSNAGSDRQSTSSHSSEDDFPFPETSTTSDSKIINSNGKTRANRGEAKDPQSLYARKRRERINERLKILQNLVPNGTKVDISTMLEDAVHYVKFLQLQIKLLSSDDLWMYAPICYNGVDVGLNQKLSALLKPINTTVGIHSYIN